ncbi:3-hydroxyacyl-CoA dehydrogenase NAD-binding domain-containing protein [Rhodovibrionaceae bacterium A322]
MSQPITEIKKVAVIGAGVMGAGIAAHCANAGLEVVLLDIVPDGAKDRSVIAKTALQKLAKANPAAFMSKRFIKRVRPGNIEDDLALLADCDWIVEVVIERLDIKQDLYRKIDGVRKSGSLVSSNTSTLPLAKLVEGLPESFRQDFMITHFFNPPRYMRLLEVVPGPDTRQELFDVLSDFADRVLGKGVVECKDTPGFIANRIGTYWLQAAVIGALDHGLSVEEADAIMGRPFGFPKTGVFGLIDLVGLDLMPYVDASLAANLSETDGYMALRRDIPLISKMIETGYTGRKGKGGFYRLDRSGGKKTKQAIDLATGDYRAVEKPQLDSIKQAKTLGTAGLLAAEDRGGRYAAFVIGGTLAYAAGLLPEIADDIVAVDEAMRLGYNWKYGPFELMDRIGAGTLVAQLEKAGQQVPGLLALAAEKEGFYRVTDGQLEYLALDGSYRPVQRPDGVLLLADIKRASKPVAKNGSASLWNLGDGVLCLEFHTKMNALDPDVLKMMEKAIKLVRAKHKALVFYNEGSNFSVGANLGLALFAANTALWPMIEASIAGGQKVYQALKYAPFPVVAAPSGMALGGGCELLLHSDAVQASAESYIGLVEVGAGVVPGWGGCKEMLGRLSHNKRRPRGPMPAVAEAFETIGTAKVAKSAYEAMELGFLSESDSITFNRDRLLADAKARALALAEDYQPPEPRELTLPGEAGLVTLKSALRDLAMKGLATPHDQVVAGELALVLTGGPGADTTEPLSEERLLELEREAFLRLLKNNATLDRMESLLTTGKPLRN